MRSHDTTVDQDSRSRAAANDQQRKDGSGKGGRASPGPAAQHKRQKMIDSSPYVTSQRRRLTDMPGQTLQKQVDPEEEEELMQGKLALQRLVEDEEELMQGQFAAQRQPEEEEELMQGKFCDPRSAAMEGAGQKPIQQKPDASDENRTGLPDNVKARMEDTFATDFSDVRVHPNSGKAAAVRARAYTQGTDVHFAPGQFKPQSSAGQQLLGHELTHVVQQRQGRVRPTGEVAGMPLNDSPALENEADTMGKKIIE